MRSSNSPGGPERKEPNEIVDVLAGKELWPEFEAAIYRACQIEMDRLSEEFRMLAPGERPPVELAFGLNLPGVLQLCAVSESRRHGIIGTINKLGNGHRIIMACKGAENIFVDPHHFDPITGRESVEATAMRERNASRGKLLVWASAAIILVAGSAISLSMKNDAAKDELGLIPPGRLRESTDVERMRSLFSYVYQTLTNSYPTFGREEPWMKSMVPGNNDDLDDAEVVLEYLRRAENELAGRSELYKKILEEESDKEKKDPNDRKFAAAMRAIADDDQGKVEHCLTSVRATIAKYEQRLGIQHPRPPANGDPTSGENAGAKPTPK